MHQNYTYIYIPWKHLCVHTKFIIVITIGFFGSLGPIWIWECILDGFNNHWYVVCSQWSSLLAFALLLVVRWSYLPLLSRSWPGAICDALVTATLSGHTLASSLLLLIADSLRIVQTSGNDAGSGTACTTRLFGCSLRSYYPESAAQIHGSMQQFLVTSWLASCNPLLMH